MTLIEQEFGEGTRLKDLTEEQRKHLNCVYAESFRSKMTPEERKEYDRNRMRRFRKKNPGYYQDYQTRYRRERIENDEEFRERVNTHAKNYYQRKKAQKEAELNGD